MSRIFISHSQKDEDIISLFSKVFGSTHVRSIFMEYEKMVHGHDIKSEDIKKEMQNSAALFIILSKNVKNNAHTRDWILWESGVAASLGKDIWIFELNSDFGKIDVVIPYFTHYIPIDLNLKEVYAYLRSIIESYDDSQILPNALAFGFLGMIGATILAPPKQQGDAAVLGGALGGSFGAITGDKSHLRPMGTSTQCIHCKRLYHVHCPFNFKFRCPGCNNYLTLIPQKLPPQKSKLKKDMQLKS